MPISRPSICLVTPAHPANNPRLVKEAGGLQAAGFDVHVITGRYLPSLDVFDAQIYREARWAYRIVDYTSGIQVFQEKFRRRLARWRLNRGAPPTPETAMHAHHAAISLLAEAAAEVKADLYIGHCLAGLAAAGLAAERTGARLGFDAEDFHSAETSEAENHLADVSSVRAIESRWLPRCAHLTAASPLIGQAYADRYGVPVPTTILNVFPKDQAPVEPLTGGTGREPAVLYWFSQTIGPGRGLEPLIGVLGRMRTSCALHLRGLPSRHFPEELQNLALASGFRGPIQFLPLAPPEEMARLAAGADLGLSLEQRTPRNRDLCLTNKIFTYLLAGVPVALTPTSAQKALATELGAAAVPLNLSQPAEAASALDAYLNDPNRCAAARSRAWSLGQHSFNWEAEQSRLVAAVQTALG